MEERSKLTLSLPAAASPKVVLAVASAYIELLEEVAPDLHEGSITLVVRNLSTKAALRSWNDEGEEALSRIGAPLFGEPAELAKDPETPFIADKLSSQLDEFQGGTLTFETRHEKAQRTSIDIRLMAKLFALRDEPLGGRLRGTHEVVTPIQGLFHAGRAKQLKARILIDGRRADVSVEPSINVDLLHQTFRFGGSIRARLDAHWAREGDSWRLLASATTMTGAEMAELVTGAQFLELATRPRTREELAALLRGDDDEGIS